ncbi:hypothetical protein COO60DRAFT_1523594 [Scenedesmus sp. NREL 46B-D3]|nr:hypothetical protein COO60DRAFT_1523594 [Scenedesmus sp. NREL 46B-D3]
MPHKPVMRHKPIMQHKPVMRLVLHNSHKHTHKIAHPTKTNTVLCNKTAPQQRTASAWNLLTRLPNPLKDHCRSRQQCGPGHSFLIFFLQVSLKRTGAREAAKGVLRSMQQSTGLHGTREKEAPTKVRSSTKHSHMPMYQYIHGTGACSMCACIVVEQPGSAREHGQLCSLLAWLHCMPENVKETEPLMKQTDKPNQESC